MRIRTVRDLINELEEFDPDAEVRLAIQPQWPFEHRIADVQSVPATDDRREVVYLADGGQVGYLSSEAREAVGF